ncbi:hypothetical protein OF83DRAFT_1179206 [Amylostereum chailletii]|nr:hypothetical protein OF83DRAFT_1179206 [Amylostereum chailletii]
MSNLDFTFDRREVEDYPAPRLTTIDGLPSPAPSHSHTPPNPKVLHITTSAQIPASHPDLDPRMLPNPHDTQRSPPGSPARRGYTLTDDPPAPTGSSSQSPPPQPSSQSQSQSQSQSPQPRPSSSSQRKDDSTGKQTESPTSYAPAADQTSYNETFRLFPPSPTSSQPQRQTTETSAAAPPPPPLVTSSSAFAQPRPDAPAQLQQPRLQQMQSQPIQQWQIQEQEPQDRWRDPQRQMPWPAEPASRRDSPARVSVSARAPAQQPTYVSPTPTPAQQPQVEEVCVECAMRDQDMADVDVTTRGVWARASDVAFDELLRRELEEEAAGIVPDDVSKRPRARGGRLTEANLKLWLQLNPKEPASKKANLDTYVKAQRALLEEEALAHARAMQESRQINDRMRDTYSQLRHSTYDLAGHAPPEDGAGLKLKSAGGHQPGASHARDVTLLENGLIVEHVDVRKEERERRREEKRARARSRKSSRGSMADVASMYSAASPVPHTDGGFPHLGVRSTTSASRPMSVLTAPLEGEYYGQGQYAHHPGTFSTTSVESPNRRTRFFGNIRTLSQGFRSSDSLAPSGFSGSMVDMHVALHREQARNSNRFSQAPGESLRPSSLWQDSSLSPQRAAHDGPAADDGSSDPTKPKKKKKGLAKLWGIVTGSSAKSGGSSSTSAPNQQTRSLDREDDYPLAPPPPLSYLVNRGTGGGGATGGGGGGEGGSAGPRHVSTPSLPSTSPNHPSHAFSSSAGVSPPSAPSSILPSPTSSRPLGVPDGVTHGRKGSGNTNDSTGSPPPLGVVGEDPTPVHPAAHAALPMTVTRSVHPMTSEPDMRYRLSQSMASEPAPPVPRLPATISTGRPASWRDKSLPPLPGEMHGGGGAPRRMMHPSQYGHPPSQHPPPPQLETRPRTLFTYDADPSAALVAPHAPFRLEAGRRQSFGGLGSAPNMHMHVQTDAQAYAEFGAQRRAPPGPATTTTPTPTKRKSKFGFASLLGKKTTPAGKGSEREPQETGVEYPFPATATATAHSSGSEARHEAQMMGFGGAAPSMMSVGMSVGSVTSASGHQQLQQAQFPRMSMSLASKKNIEHLVDQAPDFVAYRYPSGDAPLGIVR